MAEHAYPADNKNMLGFSASAFSVLKGEGWRGGGMEGKKERDRERGEGETKVKNKKCCGSHWGCSSKKKKICILYSFRHPEDCTSSLRGTR